MKSNFGRACFSFWKSIFVRPGSITLGWPDGIFSRSFSPSARAQLGLSVRTLDDLKLVLVDVTREFENSTPLQPLLHIIHEMYDLCFNGWRVPVSNLSDQLDKGLGVDLG